MAVLHKEFIQFNREVKLTTRRKKDLIKSRKEIKRKVKSWFRDNKPEEIQPKFWGQGSFEMNTIVNPIPEYDKDENKLLKYDLDYGIYFLEEAEDNRRSISTWHDWIYEAVKNHTNQPSVRKTTCVRVIFADGHHLDLPIYYKNRATPELAHRSKGWIESDPKQFTEWFLEKSRDKKQLIRLVRYLKAWKNFQEHKYSNLKLPSGFILTILTVRHYKQRDNDDHALRETVRSMHEALTSPGGFICLRPTTPRDEDLFSEYSESRKNDFLERLKVLTEACESAHGENNFKKGSEYFREQFGERFPLGEDVEQKKRSDMLATAIAGTEITHKPYHA